MERIVGVGKGATVVKSREVAAIPKNGGIRAFFGWTTDAFKSKGNGKSTEGAMKLELEACNTGVTARSNYQLAYHRMSERNFPAAADAFQDAAKVHGDAGEKYGESAEAFEKAGKKNAAAAQRKEQLFSAMWQLCAIGKQYEALVFTHNVLEKDSGQAYLFSGYVNLTAEGVAVKLKQCAQEAVGCVKKLAELAQKDGGQLDFAWEKARFTLIEGGAPAELLRNALAFAETTSRKLRANVLAEIGAAIINLEWSPNKPPAPRGLDLEYMPLYAQVALAR